MTDHNFLHIAAIVAACAMFVFTIMFTSGALGHPLGLFVNGTGGLAEKYNLGKYQMDVTPAEWTFYISAFIYVWQLVWLTYGVGTVCRRVPGSRDLLYTHFPVLPPILYVVFAFALACNVSWLLIWDREYMEIALVFVDLMSCTLYICLIVSLRRLNDYGAEMVATGMRREIWMIRIFVQNGLGLFASWGSVAAMFNFAVVLKYRTGARAEVGSTVSLAIFTMEIVAWWVFDNFVFERLLRYMFTPYAVVIFSLAGIVGGTHDLFRPNSIYVMLLLALTAVLFIVKLVLVVYRHNKYPMFVPKPSYSLELPEAGSVEVHGLLETRA
ncbi:hypothetical protein LSAT2_021348 [Lamellibrachia satsuma]|nr:hypothetical protein LSAT2_021348 [Lamellibrachia satsuma]